MLHGGWRHAGTLLVALLGAWLGTATAQNTEPGSSKHEDSGATILFAIDRGPLVDAIRQFAEQTDIQVTADFGQRELQQRVVPEIRESLTARAALERILEGTGLTARWRSAKTVRITPGPVAPHAHDGVDEVFVTGSRIRGDGEGPAPVRTYTRADIDRFGVSSIPGLAGYFTQQPYSFGEWQQPSGAQHFQMRGLGVDTTLVLINGRRAPPSATSVTLNAFDLNTIPLTAVERIEVMSDSASAIYGSDAIGGVVNIIMKDGADSSDVYVHYGEAAGGAEERRLAGTLGGSGERVKGSLTLDYFERGMLIGADRDLWRDQDYRRFGGRDYRVTTANPANVYAVSGTLPGLPTAQASVPASSSGIGLRPEDFLSTAGVINRYSSQSTLSILPETERISAFGTAEVKLGEESALFAEVLTATSDVVRHGALPVLSRQLVPATNPYNPFGQDVLVDKAMVGMNPIAWVTESDFARFVVGGRGKIGRWDWELAGIGTNEHVSTDRGNDIDPLRVSAALNSTDPQAALNPFADGPAGSATLLSSLVADPQQFRYTSRGRQVSGFLRGGLFQLPGGLSEFVLGGEWRKEQFDVVDSVTDLKRDRDIGSAFAEFRMPLLSALTAKVAVRGDYYEGTADSVNPQYGLVWRPATDWLIRAAYGTSFRPPSLLELHTRAQPLDFLTPISDARRGGTSSLVQVTAGGNPGLENVSAHSFTAGFVYRPSLGPGLHVGAHYWRVVMDDRIISPRASDVQKLEQIMPDRVKRSDPTESDRLAGWPGAIEALNTSLINYGHLETSGIDLDLSYEIDGTLGRWRTTLVATWVDEYASQDLSSVLPLDRVGIADLLGTIPKWRLVGSLAWDGLGWGASTTTTFTQQYTDIDPIVPTNRRRLPSRTIVDVQAWLEFDRFFDARLFEGLILTAGALNVFDREPNFTNANLMVGFDMSQADLRQRFAYLRITKRF